MAIIFCDIDGTLKYRNGYNEELVKTMTEILSSGKHMVIFWSTAGKGHAEQVAFELFGGRDWIAMTKQKIDLKEPIFIDDAPDYVLPLIEKVPTPVFFWPKQIAELETQLAKTS
jgi:hypothetical protein